MALSTERQLEQIESEFGEAQPKRDLALLDRLMGDDFAAIISNGKIVDKSGVMAQLASPDLEIDSLINDQIRVRVFGDAAVAIGEPACW